MLDRHGRTIHSEPIKAVRVIPEHLSIYEYEPGKYMCDIGGGKKCGKMGTFRGTEREVLGHQRYTEHPDTKLFVYLPHHLVFKTDMVISVNAHV
jgi:hypothetical protein